jgi:hypothetical protein
MRIVVLDNYAYLNRRCDIEAFNLQSNKDVQRLQEITKQGLELALQNQGTVIDCNKMEVTDVEVSLK